MKTIQFTFLSLCFILLTISLQAQVIYNDTDGPADGKIGFEKGISLVLVDKYKLEAAGADQFWDFTGGDADSFLLEGTIFITASQVPIAPLFKGANLVSTTYPDSDSSLTFYKKTSNGLFQVGQYDPALGNAVFTHPLIELPYPLEYRKTFQDSGSATVPTQLGDAKLSIQHNSEVDAWGTVKTPLGSFPALRVKRNSLIEALIGGFLSVFSSTTNDYEWYTPGYAFPIARFSKGEYVTFDVPEVDTSASYLTKQTAVKVQDYSKIHLKLSPNPASDFIELNFDNTNERTIRILNTEGKAVLETTTGNMLVKFNTKNLINGSYLVQVFDKNGNWNIEKLIINK